MTAVRRNPQASLNASLNASLSTQPGALAAPAFADQAQGLRRLFSVQPEEDAPRLLPLVSNPHVAYAGLMIEQLLGSLRHLGHRVLLVDAAETAPAPSELAVVDPACAVQAIGPQLWYLAAPGLADRHLDGLGRSTGLLQALRLGVPQADFMVLHAPAAELARLRGAALWQPMLLADTQAESLTHAYASLKWLALRGAGRAFDLLLDAHAAPLLGWRAAQRLHDCARRFLQCGIERAVHWDALDGHPEEVPRELLELLQRRWPRSASDARHPTLADEAWMPQGPGASARTDASHAPHHATRMNRP